MKLLFCAEFYYPSVGGVQEVVRQLAERFAAQGNDVTVATTMLKNRNVMVHNGVNIKSFHHSGNNVRGIQGDLTHYHDFLLSSAFDLIFVYAAQQWTFDALWSIIEKIKAKKIIVPCGYSGLSDPAYKDYFQELPKILKQFDHIIYHAMQYRDFTFGQQYHLNHYSIIPNGADNAEFSVTPDTSFKKRMGISEDATLVITVGTFTGTKGHLEVIKAYEIIIKHNKNITLILNGNTMPDQSIEISISSLWKLITGYAKTNGWYVTSKILISRILIFFGVKVGLQAKIHKVLARINKNQKSKVIICDLPRQDLIQAYLQSDLFVFASNIEYSPLVLYEACAAGLPFLSVPVGNSEEIACWTGGGEICPAPVDNKGYTKVNPQVLAEKILALLENQQKLATLSNTGKKAWEEQFNWNSIYKKYESIFIETIKTKILHEIT